MKKIEEKHANKNKFITHFIGDWAIAAALEAIDSITTSDNGKK